LNNPDNQPEKLRLVPNESAEELARRIAREQRTENYQREDSLSQSLAPFRVGSVPYLNAVPVVRGIEDELVLATPSELATMLRDGRLDAALVSVTEVLFNDQYDVLDNVSIASLGEVKSVLLAHRGPLDMIREVFCDPASLTSMNLLRVLLAERGIHPQFSLLPSYEYRAMPDYALLIGDNAIDFSRAPHEHELWDLGAAWYEMTKLPFVYAVWALRRDKDTSQLRRNLREACDFGLDTLDMIIRSRTEYDLDFRKDYLGWHIHYHLGADEKRGLAKFVELLRKHGDQPVFEPRFVE
jgi:predicted solute-binding protein